MSLTFFYLLFLFFLFAVPRWMRAGRARSAPARKARGISKHDKDQPAKRVKRGKDLPELKKSVPKPFLKTSSKSSQKTSGSFFEEGSFTSESFGQSPKALQNKKTASFSLRQAVLYQEILRLPKALRRREER